MAYNVYIATLPRSGSTLLGMILGNHPQVCHVGESSYWCRLSPHDQQCSCGIFSCPVLLEIQSALVRHPLSDIVCRTYQAIDMRLAPNKQRQSKSIVTDASKSFLSWEEIGAMLVHCPEILNVIADEYRKKTHKQVVVDNTKLIHITEIIKNEPSWQIILLTRDPRGIMWSYEKNGLRKGLVRRPEEKFSELCDFAKRAVSLRSLPEVLSLRYEDLCQDPRLAIGSVCDFLDIAFFDDMLNFRKEVGHFLMGNHMRFGSDIAITEDHEWRTKLDMASLAKLYDQTELCELYLQLGYDLKD